MNCTPKTLLLGTAVLAGGLAITFAAFAQSTPQNQQGRMGNNGMMGGGMMPMMNQMNRMAENCNHMMERAMRDNMAPMPDRAPAQKTPG